MSDDSQKPVQKFRTPLEKRLLEEEDRTLERAKLLDKQNDGSTRGSDILLPPSMQHNYTNEWESRRKNFQDKVYLFPESYNALRRELDENWRNLFNNINPETGVSLAYCMVFDAPQFIGILNGALDLAVQYDTENIDQICKTFLDALRVKRGVSRLN